jgi:hypothetical protein
VLLPMYGPTFLFVAIAHGFQPDDTVRRDPLRPKEALKILEHLYDLVLDIEQLRREQSSIDAEDPEAVDNWCVCRSLILNYLRISLTRPKEFSALRTCRATMGRPKGYGAIRDKASPFRFSFAAHSHDHSTAIPIRSSLSLLLPKGKSCYQGSQGTSPLNKCSRR